LSVLLVEVAVAVDMVARLGQEDAAEVVVAVGHTHSKGFPHHHAEILKL